MRAIDRIIEVKVRGAHLTKDNRNAGVQGEANVTHLRVDFDEGWDGYAKTVTFWDALMDNPVKRTLTTNLLEDVATSTRIYIVPIPGEAMTEAGDMTFIIDGYVDGKRKRSISDTLFVHPAPYEDEAGEPVDPSPSQAEQLQEQIDTIKGQIQGAVNAGTEALTYAEFAKGQAQDARDAALYSQTWANESLEHRNEAERQAGLAAKYAAEVHEVAGGDFATPTEAQRYADNAEEAANQYTDTKAAEIAGDKISQHNQDKTAHPAIQAELALVARAKTGGEIDQRLQNRIEKTGDKMTGILEFDTPGLFSAIQKRRTIGAANYMMRVGIGSYGDGGNISLRLVTIGADGSETGAGQFDIDANGLVWVTPGGIRKTVAHSGNLGVLSAGTE